MAKTAQCRISTKFSHTSRRPANALRSIVEEGVYEYECTRAEESVRERSRRAAYAFNLMMFNQWCDAHGAVMLDPSTLSEDLRRIRIATGRLSALGHRYPTYHA